MSTVPPQSSAAVSDVLSAGGTPLAQLTVVSAGKALITGPVISSTVMVWFLEVMLPHTDRKSDVWGKGVELGGRRIIKKKTSWLMVTVPPQPSVAVTDVLSAAGTPLAQLAVVS